MYKHHEDSIQNLINYFKDDPGVLAVVLGGSVAKGLERADSDLDALVVVTDERFEQLARERRLAECVHGHCTYEHGYFDVKYSTLDYLRTAAERGSEPCRNAWLKARCLFSRAPEIEALIGRIGTFQQAERDEKLLSFFSALTLSKDYLWSVSKGNTYLRVRTATDIVLYSFRMLLEEAGVLFSCHKSLELQIAALPEKPEGILDKSRRLLTELSDEARNEFVDAILSFMRFRPPEDFATVLTRYVDDNELWWYKNRPVLAEW